MHKTVEHNTSPKKGSKTRKTAGQRQGLIKTNVQPVSTIIQSLAAMSNVRMEDIVEQLVKEQRVIDAAHSKKVKTVSKKGTSKLKQSTVKKTIQSGRQPKRKSASSPQTARSQVRETTKNVGDSNDAIVSNDNAVIGGKWKMEKLDNDLAKKGVVLLTRITETTRNDKVKTESTNDKRPAVYQNNVETYKVQCSPTIINQKTVSSSSALDARTVQKPDEVTAAKDSPGANVTLKNSTTVGQAPPNSLITVGKGDMSVNSSKTTVAPKSVHEMKMHLIERFNQKRMEEKPKAQLSQERLSQVSGANSSSSNSKTPLQNGDAAKPSTPGTLMNLGIGMKRSEMLEKEFQSVGHLVPKKRYLELKLRAEEAVRKEMTFAVCGRVNGWLIVRRFFAMRNWVERFENGEDKKSSLPNLSPAPDHDASVLSRLTSRMPVKFIWSEVSLNWTLIAASTIVNKYPASIRPLSTKVGLLLHLNNQVWTYNANYSYVKFPRSISLYDDEDMKSFSALFRINACICLLKHLVEGSEQEKNIIVPNGTVPLDTLDFAVQRVCEQVTYMENADIDVWHDSLVSEDEWTLFLLRFQDIAHYGANFKADQGYNIPKLVASAKLCLKHVKEFWPDIDVEGIRNLWIVKPSASSCGRGIKIFKSLVDIQQHVRPGVSFLAQKYIERPMFIHKTKFDIRQWFVVTSMNPLVIYMYDICYLRFCSREFSLVNLHESVHLSNNSVQCRYSNMTNRSPELPSDNMWDSDTFIAYLRSRKEDDKWYAISLPGIRKGIIGAYLASQDMLTHRNNSFNLYGADFMLTEDFVPWLIEINSGPCLRNTTSVTSRLCPMVIEDTISLVLKTMHSGIQGQLPDTKPGQLNECGRFKLIFSQKIQAPPANTGRSDLAVTAKKARIHIANNYNDRRKQGVAIPILKEDNEDQKLTTYDSRSLKYQKIADYKTHSGATVRSTTLEDTKRPPIPPGGVIPADLAAYRTDFQKSDTGETKTNSTKTASST